MVRIITESNDHTIQRLIDYLVEFNIEFERLNTDEFYEFNIENLEASSNIKVIFNRRGGYSLIPNVPYSKEVKRYLKKEVNDVVFFKEYLEDTSILRIGSLKSELDNNKLINLKIAKKHGFKIPDSIVTNSKSDLLKFVIKYKAVITKDLKHPTSWIQGVDHYSSKGTFVITTNHTDNLSEFFSPIFLQEKIIRQFEIRTFFFLDEFYSIAIIPPNENVIDVRSTYNKNRMIPFNLPEDIRVSLLNMANVLNLKTFSSDIILDNNNDYYFIELNPMGQYDFVDKFGNYNIPKQMALKIKNYLN